MSSRTPVLTDDDRFPLIPEERRQLLTDLREHPHAPIFNYGCGDRLTATGLEEVRRYESALAVEPRFWQPGKPPPWVEAFAERCLRTVPFYRGRGGDPGDLTSIPPCDRTDLERGPEAFVPDDQPLDDIMVYDTSGTVGPVVRVPSHPVAAAKYLPVLRSILKRRGVTLEGGPDRVAIALVCAQAYTLTYATLSAYLGGAAHVKINLNPRDWHDPDDRMRFLDGCDPEIVTGDPYAFAELAKLPLAIRPKALVSTAMALTDGLRSDLGHRFGCPVLDVYSLTEARMVAVREGDVHVVAAHDMYVEILDDDGAPLPAGERGEITLTCPRNPFQPLLRYRTGDFAALEARGEDMTLVGLEGRRPVALCDDAGRPVNTIDVTHVLRRFSLPVFRLSQARDGALTLEVPQDAEADPVALRAAILSVFGARQTLSIRPLDPAAGLTGKVQAYVSELDDISALPKSQTSPERR